MEFTAEQLSAIEKSVGHGCVAKIIVGDYGTPSYLDVECKIDNQYIASRVPLNRYNSEISAAFGAVRRVQSSIACYYLEVFNSK